eukprot:303669_1
MLRGMGVRSDLYWVEAYLRVTNQLANDALRQGVLGNWLFAFARGVSCVIKLYGHTDEGGYARRAAMTADYPMPHGWINAPRDTNALYVSRTLVRPDTLDALADCMELLVQTAGLLHDAEPLAPGTENGDAYATVMISDSTDRTHSGIARPCDYVGMLQHWHTHALTRLPIWQGQNLDTRKHGTNIWQTYTCDQRPDRYLGNYGDEKGILPFCWVEACGVNLSCDGCTLPGPGGVNCERGLTYMESDLTTNYSGAFTAEDRRGCIIGDIEMYRIKHWQLRAQGMTYVCHARFSPFNGLSAVHFRLADTHTLNLADEVNLSVDGRAESSIADKTWKRLHCPVPFNGEVSIVGDVSAGLVCAGSAGTNFFSASEHHP